MYFVYIYLSIKCLELLLFFKNDIGHKCTFKRLRPAYFVIAAKKKMHKRNFIHNPGYDVLKCRPLSSQMPALIFSNADPNLLIVFSIFESMFISPIQLTD